MATEPAPEGVFPLFIRGSTCQKFGMKTGEGVMDLVDYIYLRKDVLLKDIQDGGAAMSDFYPAKKLIDSYPGENILIMVDSTGKHGENFLLCYTDAAQDSYMSKFREAEAALEAQRQAEIEAEEAQKAAAWARANIVYEDKPMSAKPWVSGTSADTDGEIRWNRLNPHRDIISIEVTRPARNIKQPYRFSDRLADTGGVSEFRASKDPNFTRIRESEGGFQVAPMCTSSSAQTTWYKPVNKSVQYESASMTSEPLASDAKDDLLSFLERVTVKIENALQQNESVDIFHETFRMVGDDEILEGAQAENELRELKNFGDPTYSKSKAIVAIDWMPKMSGLVAVSPVKCISFDQRVLVSGQTNTAFILLWDFKQLVKPQLLMQSQYEIFAFQFNRTTPGLVAGGCITGQVMLWDIANPLDAAMKRNNRGTVGTLGAAPVDEEDEGTLGPVLPKYVSSVDHSHKRCVSELFWLPPTTQINFRGQLVGPEHLDGNSYQFVTIAADGLVLVWDIRFEKMAQPDDVSLRHIGRAKHVPTEKASTRDGGQLKALWAPIFRAHLKRLEGVGELSLCKVSSSGFLKPSVASKSSLPGDHRSHLMIGTEEGDIIFADLSARKAESGSKEDDEEDVEAGREFVRWIAEDHARPSVGFQQSPFFPDILLSVSDWSFHIWKAS